VSVVRNSEVRGTPASADAIPSDPALVRAADGTPHRSDLVASLARRVDDLITRCGDIEHEHAELLRELRARDAASAAPSGSQLPRASTSASNLLHYLAIRREDLRDVHWPLAELGLSSLGRIESHVLANLLAVRRALTGLGASSSPFSGLPPVSLADSRTLLEQRTQSLLGPRSEEARGGRGARIMVTLPTQAATDAALVRDLIDSGMTCARINTAHDDAEAWVRMGRVVREQAAALGRTCRVLMDLAGPKLRTGPMEPGPEIVRFKPERDVWGRVVKSARVTLAPRTAGPAIAGELPVDLAFLAGLIPGAEIELTDARGKLRVLTITQAPDAAGRVFAACESTAYIASGTQLRLRSEPRARTEVGRLPALQQSVLVRPGDRLDVALDASRGKPGDGRGVPGVITCTLPEVFRHARVGEPVWIDDGKIGTVIEAITPTRIVLRITLAAAKGDRIREDKGINLPETDIALPGLTDDDIAAIPIAAAHADLVGISFVRTPSDVADVRARLDAQGGRHVGTILKIETRRAFENLPGLLLESLKGPGSGVMIARGDLAVEVGYERLAEVQEEVLWLCEAAHVPVIWATQVLESLAKSGRPSRAEVTDAAMGERAECVMLNKGPYILDAVRFLSDLVRRMEAHQSKKRPMLRALAVARDFEYHGANKPAAEA